MLVQDRNDMLEYFLKGGKPHGLLEDYRENRNSESWRVSRQVEELMEWVWLSYGKSGQIGVNINQNYQRAKGYLDYINYFNEKLK